MNKPDSLETLTLAKTFEQFLESAPFARRTRESYAEDLAPLLRQYGQASVTVLTTEIIQAYLARQETLAPTTYNGVITFFPPIFPAKTRRLENEPECFPLS